MRSLWSGNISFGLINIPIHMYSATEERTLDFEMLRRNDLCPVKYTRVCRSSGEEVPFKDIVKGYEYREGDYVVLEKEDFKKASPKKTQTIDIGQFVKEEEIDSKYFEKPYYLEPAKGADKAYVLLREALKQAHKVAVAKYVFRTREDLVVLKPDNDVIILNQLRFSHEIRPLKGLTLPKVADVSKEEIEMAIKLIDNLTSKFDEKKYHDTYTEQLEKVIESKAEGKEIKTKIKQIEPTKSGDLMAQLRASLQHP